MMQPTKSGGTAGRPPGVPRWTWAEACARRLQRHALSVPWAGAAPADIAGAICGAHAQVLTAAELSIGLRLAESTQVAVRNALWTEHSLIKTYGPRGTVHLLATRDLPMWTGALAAVPPAANLYGKDSPLTPEQLEEIVGAIGVALENAELTTGELTQALAERVGAWAGDLVLEAFRGKWPRWRRAESVAVFRGVLCFGPNRGRQVTYTHPRRWLPGFCPAEGRAALAELVMRYLHAYGPATAEHFARWLGAPPRWAAELFHSLSAGLEPVELAGTSAWVPAGDSAPPSTQSGGVHLLPYFDAYVVGCHPRRLLYPGLAAERALPHGGAGNFPVLLVDGVVAGIWHQHRSGRKIDITVEPFDSLTADQREQLDVRVEGIGRFLGSDAQATIGTVSTGWHA